jgi:serine/threonine protein kinase/predicted Zn-dependent protease
MSVSASRRTWEEASSPAAVRLARAFEQAWRDNKGLPRRPDPQEFLDSAGASIDAAGARLALLRADLSLRREAGEAVGVRWYLERYPCLDEDTIVALIYEEFCLREDEGERLDPAQYIAGFPEVAPALRRVLDIHGLVGSGSTRTGSLLVTSGSGEHACTFPEAGQTIAGFFLVEELGRGSFARVFLARERELADRPVALKVTRRGSREPQTLARLQHTHIVPVHSHRIDRATGLHLLCMPYFGRITLAQVLADVRETGFRSGSGLVESLDRLASLKELPAQSSGRAALERRTYDRAIAWWGARLAEALEHAHERGVLHRDIKPSNVLVTSDGMPMLLDFNLAREPLAEGDDADATTPGGTVDYMAPEHLRTLADGYAEGLDHRSDIYSLGVVLFEALTGRRPFAAARRGSSLVEALHRAADERGAACPSPRSIDREIPPALDAVVRRCLEPEPADRYRSVGELADDLRAVADDLPLAYAREPLSSRVGGWLRRKRRKLAVAAALALALFIVTATILGASLGYMLITDDGKKYVASKYQDAVHSLETGDYLKAKAQFDEFNKLADHFDRLDPLHYQASGRGFMGTLPAILEKLRGLREVPDIDELKARARDKGELAARHARVRRYADDLRHEADRLRFRLLLDPEDLPDLSRELRRVLHPFYVLENADWATLEHTIGMLDPDQQVQVKDDVNELLFLWAAALDRSPSLAGVDSGDPTADAKEQQIVSSAVEICDRALTFARPREPWLALRSRLTRDRRGGGPEGTTGAAGLFIGEPRGVEAEPSALESFQWGLLDLWAGRMERAVEWMRHAVRSRGDNYWYQFFLAYVEDQAGHADEALEHYGAAAALRPSSPWIRFSRAKFYRSRGRWAYALEDLDLALRELKVHPEARRILLDRGYLYQMMGDFARAREDYDFVAGADAADDLGRAARLNRANLDTDSGDYEGARREYDALLADDLRDTTVRHSRAILELRTGQAALAERDLSALLSMDRIRTKDRIEFLAERAQARLMMGQAAEAVADAREARGLHRCPAHDRLAQRALLAARRYDELQLDRPEDVTLLPLRGPRLDAELRDAARWLDRVAAGRDGIAFRAGLTRAVILAALGEARQARAAADRAFSLSPFSAEARLVRSRVLASAGDRRGAAAEVERGLAIHPDEPGLLELRATLRLAEGDPERALEDYDAALARGPRDRIHLGKASALLALRDYRTAVDEWSLALRRDPELPEAFLGRARTYLLLREWDLALADLEQAAAWAHADPRIEAAVAICYLRCLVERPDRLPRLLVHLRRAAGDFWLSLETRHQLAAGLD